MAEQHKRRPSDQQHRQHHSKNSVKKRRPVKHDEFDEVDDFDNVGDKQSTNKSSNGHKTPTSNMDYIANLAKNKIVQMIAVGLVGIGVGSIMGHSSSSSSNGQQMQQMQSKSDEQLNKSAALADKYKKEAKEAESQASDLQKSLETMKASNQITQGISTINDTTTKTFDPFFTAVYGVNATTRDEDLTNAENEAKKYVDPASWDKIKNYVFAGAGSDRTTEGGLTSKKDGPITSSLKSIDKDGNVTAQVLVPFTSDNATASGVYLITVSKDGSKIKSVTYQGYMKTAEQNQTDQE